MPKSSWGAKKHILLFWKFFVLGQKRYFVEKIPILGEGGGVFPRGNFSHLIPFLILKASLTAANTCIDALDWLVVISSSPPSDTSLSCIGGCLWKQWCFQYFSYNKMTSVWWKPLFSKKWINVDRSFCNFEAIFDHETSMHTYVHTICVLYISNFSICGVISEFSTFVIYRKKNSMAQGI